MRLLFVQIVRRTIYCTARPPATGNQPKIDIDPPPVSPQVERPLPRDAELFKSPAKRKRHDSDGAQTFQLRSLSSYQIHNYRCRISELNLFQSIYISPKKWEAESRHKYNLVLMGIRAVQLVVNKSWSSWQALRLRIWGLGGLNVRGTRSHSREADVMAFCPN